MVQTALTVCKKRQVKLNVNRRACDFASQCTFIRRMRVMARQLPFASSLWHVPSTRDQRVSNAILGSHLVFTGLFFSIASYNYTSDL
jgi:hypothetical protein